MKKIAIVTSLFLAVVFPRPSFAYLFGVTEVQNQCNKNDYAIVYINGVLNSEKDAEHGKKELARTIGYIGLTKFNNRPVVVHKAFNPSHIGGIGDGVASALQKAFDQAQNTMVPDYDANEMIAQMHNEVKEGRILFVGHSQGNFYANTIYGWLATRENGLSTSSMAMYNVASPAHLAAPHTRYLLSKNDKVIAGLVGAVGSIAPPNVEFPLEEFSKDPLGHNFVDTYLHYGGKRIAEDIKAQLALLEVDKGKNAEFPCVPEPNTGIAHLLLGAYFDLVDPITLLARNTIVDLANFAYVLTGSVFSHDRLLHETSLRGTAGLPDLRATSTLTYSFTPSNEFPTTEPSLLLPEVEKTAIEKQIVVKPKKVDPDAELKLALLERIALLKRLLKAEAKLESQLVTSSVLRGGGTLPTARAHALDEASTTAITRVAPLHFELEDNLPESHAHDGLDPTGGHLLITEYYIGKEGEASWVELMNTTDKWLDMRNAEFVDDNERTPFPLTGIPPKKFVVLRSEGAMAHAVLQSEAPYRMIVGLRGGLRVGGDFAVLAARNLVDRAPYGPSYCANAFKLRRSCERMVTAFPGDNPEYWVRARALETPTQYENASTIGYENQAWNYHIYEGKLVTGHFPGEVLPRGNYVTGVVDIPMGADWRVDSSHPWMLAIPDAAIFGGTGQTVVHVYGTLNIWKTGAIDVNKNFANYSSIANRPIIETIPYILVHEGGVLVRDPYAYLNAPLVIRGGIVRVNTIASRMRLESGKLYLTYYNDGTSPPSIPSCDEYRDRSMALEWLGGKVYRMGVDCGSSLKWTGQDGDDPLIGPNDPFGVVASASTQDCRIYYASRNASDCSEFYGLPPGSLDPPWEEPPAVAGTSTATTTPPVTSGDATSTATSTPPTTQENGSSTTTASTTATSTPPTSSQNSTSTASTTPPAEGTATSTSTTTPPTDPPGAVLGTSTATTTSPGGDGNGTTTPPSSGDGVGTTTSTSTPSSSGDSSASSTATSTTPIGGDGSATSTATSTSPVEGGGFSTSTASTTSPIGDGGGGATSTPNVFCYNGPPYYDGITIAELNATCGNGWAPRPTIFPITTWGRNPFEDRMQITEYYIGGEGEASWFKVADMMGYVPVDLGVTDIFMGDTRVPFPVLSILARQYVLLRTQGALINEPPASSMNGGVETTQQYAATILPSIIGDSGSIRFNYTTSARFPGTDIEVLNFTRGVCRGVITPIGSCVLLRPYMIGNYPGDAGYVPWSMPEPPVINSLAMPTVPEELVVNKSFSDSVSPNVPVLVESVEENGVTSDVNKVLPVSDEDPVLTPVPEVNRATEEGISTTSAPTQPASSIVSPDESDTTL